MMTFSTLFYLPFLFNDILFPNISDCSFDALKTINLGNPMPRNLIFAYGFYTNIHVNSCFMPELLMEIGEYEYANVISVGKNGWF